ncbi:MAG: 2OG-Fe(II) oxygenase, partial [Actinomycetota bacterium]
DLPDEHPFNRQVASSKGLLADDQISAGSPLRELYDDPSFRDFVARVVGVDRVHPYADELSSVNVHFASAGRELGWHFDNSSFAVTMLVQAPEGGGVFEHVPAVRNAETGDPAYDRVEAVLDGHEPVETLSFDPGSLVLFRGRNALHRVTPVEGARTRMLVVFAFNDEPGVRLSDSALTTFYGRLSRTSTSSSTPRPPSGS